MPAIGFVARRIVGCGAIVVAIASPTFAQPPGGGFSGGYRPNPDEIVDRLDENKNGQADPEEMQGRARFFLEGLARDNGLDLSKPIKTDKLKELLKARWSGGSSSGSSSSGGSDRSRSSPSSPPAVATPGVLGFGIVTTGPPATVPGFGPPPSADSWDVIRAKHGRRVTEEVEEDMGRYDRNKDGVLDKEEIKDGRWRGDPLEYDRNKDGKLSRSEMAEREVGKDSGSSSSGSSSSGSSSYGGSSGSGGGPGYGGYRPGGGPPGYGGPGFGGGPPPQMAVVSSTGGGSGTSSSGGSSGSSGGSSSSDANDRATKMVNQILGLYDTNKDGMIGKLEMNHVHATYRKADTDSDGTISKDELSKYALSMLPAGSSSSSSSGGSSSGKSSRYGSSSRSSSGGSAGSSGDRKSYRFKTPAERLPEGLPEWFASRDADADGQVAMAEFATTWSDAKVKEFTDWDRNGDGILTPAECLKK